MLRSLAAAAAPRGSGRRRHLATTVFHPAAAGRQAVGREAATPTTSSTRSLYGQVTVAQTETVVEEPTGSLAAPGGDKVAVALGEASEAIAAARPARQPRNSIYRRRPVVQTVREIVFSPPHMNPHLFFILFTIPITGPPVKQFRLILFSFLV